MYDYIIVGSGLYGAIFAHEAMKAGKSCLVVERRSHIGGNIYTKDGKTLVRVAALRRTLELLTDVKIFVHQHFFTHLRFELGSKVKKTY